ncbi:MAG TPA: hypothetical protein VMV19_20160 [Xanthobacteraceae bacterium]|nr:hypothetical protein [Xanthobacteraceae bacterium]
MAIEHPHVSLSAPVVHRDPETLDVIETPKRDAGPNYSSHLPDISQSDYEAAKSDVLKYNRDAPPDVLARKLADLDRAAGQDGLAVKPLMDPALAETYHNAGLSAEPKQTDYKPDFSKLNDLKPDNLAAVASVTTKFVAELGLSPAIGNSVIERIVEVGAFQRTATPDQRQQFKDRQESLGLKVTGSKAALAALREKAMSVLSTASSNEFTRDLKNSLVVNDIQVLSLLATQADLMNEVERVRKQK